MARDLIESLFYYEMDRASQSQNGPTSVNPEEQGGDVFNFFKKNFFSMFSGFQVPFARQRSSSHGNKRPESISEESLLQGMQDFTFADNIEMAHFGHVELLVKGHDFILQQLTNPTWCDECGDFIWGLYKQCLRCKYCSFTCHQKCAEMVRLGCKSSPEDAPEEPQSLETSLSEASDTSHNASNDGVTEASNEKDETDSGYRSGTIPDEKLPRQPSQATLNREELKKKFEEYNTLVPGANFQLKTEKDESFQGFIKVTLNLVRPICMSLGARPPSIYEVLTKEHIIEQNTQTISFYMPRDTVKSIHVCSEISTKEVISLLLKKFHILDNPRKFALYEQELSEKGKIFKWYLISVRLRRIPEADIPLQVALQWEPAKIESIRFVLQENESGEVNWEAFSLPELNNFLRVLDREEAEYTSQLEYKYRVMKRIVLQRLKELRKERRNSKLLASQRDSMTES
ncbi:hypothetical protein FSP39_002851 [Pinctada imbricata]|uniref:Ras association domain-containing protein 1 n=1 Tax=Pinctada imbricata TaxID=66713 RepID=A0AA89BYG8_PINIB|nr:hypothetical protein FSP39_002851 [Pinctada imbricata]